MASALADPARGLLRATGERVHVSLAEWGDVEPYRKAVERSAERIGEWNPVNPHDMMARLRDTSATSYTFMVRANEVKTDPRSGARRFPLVGCINVFNLAYGRALSATLGYNAFDPYAGSGMFAEGLKLLIDIALRPTPAGLGLHRLNANVRVGNSASMGVLRSLGFRREGHARRMIWLSDGRTGPSSWWDHDMFALTREEWPPQPYGIDHPVRGVVVTGEHGDAGAVRAVAAELHGVALIDMPFEPARQLAIQAGAPVLWCAGDRADDAVQALRDAGVATRRDHEILKQLDAAATRAQIVRAALALRPSFH